MSKQKIIRPGAPPTRAEKLEETLSLLIRDVQQMWKSVQQLGLVSDGLVSAVGTEKVQAEVNKIVAAIKAANEESSRVAQIQAQRSNQGNVQAPAEAGEAAPSDTGASGKVVTIA